MSLIPEKPLVISPTLAATLGLEEAVLLQLLQECATHGTAVHSSGYAWMTIAGHKLLELAPFWNTEAIRRLSASLHEKGLLLVSGTAFSAQQDFRYAFNEKLANSLADEITLSTAQPDRQQHLTGNRPHGAKTIGHSWRPSDDALRQLAQLGVTSEFAQQQVAQFVAYWRERNVPRHSWESKFIKEVWRQWQQAEASHQRRRKEISLTDNWRPSDDALDILTRQAGISVNFIEDAIPEFVLYWRERGDVSSTWNSKFIQHVRRQWQFYTGMMDQDTMPSTITDPWQPRESVYDVLQMANIDRQFAEQLIPEFVLYWQENGTAQCSWSTKFLQYVKRQWARHNQPQPAGGTDGKQQGSYSTGRIRDRNIIDALSDHSWAS